MGTERTCGLALLRHACRSNSPCASGADAACPSSPRALLAAAVAVARCSVGGARLPHTAVLGRLGSATATGSVRGDVGATPGSNTLVGDSDGQALRALPSGHTLAPLLGCAPVRLFGCLCSARSGAMRSRASDSTQSRCMKWSRLARTGCLVRMAQRGRMNGDRERDGRRSLEAVGFVERHSA